MVSLYSNLRVESILTLLDIVIDKHCFVKGHRKSVRANAFRLRVTKYSKEDLTPRRRIGNIIPAATLKSRAESFWGHLKKKIVCAETHGMFSLY